MVREFIPAARLFTALTILTGLLYPVAVTGICATLFPRAASGSLVENSAGKIVGSSLIGQSFQNDRYFWGRISAIAPIPYSASTSGGSNYSTTNPALVARVIEDVRRLKNGARSIPVDLVTASASGLDPHISPRAARYQIDRVASARKISPQQLSDMVNRHVEGAMFGVFGEARVNVLELNLDLDKISKR